MGRFQGMRVTETKVATRMPEMYVVGDVFNLSEGHYISVSRNVLELCAGRAQLHGSRSFMMTELPHIAAEMSQDRRKVEIHRADFASDQS